MALGGRTDPELHHDSPSLGSDPCCHGPRALHSGSTALVVLTGLLRSRAFHPDFVPQLLGLFWVFVGFKVG